MLLQTLLYDKSHRGLSFPTKINQLDLAFRFYDPKTIKIWTFHLGHDILKMTTKTELSLKVTVLESW